MIRREPVMFGQGDVTLLDSMGCDHDIVNAARVSLNCFSEEWSDKDKKLLKFLILNSHTSPLEMAEFKFGVNCPLPIARQWFKHRTWSYNEVSRRYTKSKLQFYLPPVYRMQSKDNKQTSMDDGIVLSGDISKKVSEHVASSVALYHEMLNKGVCREQARLVLPQSMMVNFLTKVDGNNLMKFVILRAAKEAQWEIQEFAVALVKLTLPRIGEVWRNLFEYIGLENYNDSLARVLLEGNFDA